MCKKERSAISGKARADSVIRARWFIIKCESGKDMLDTMLELCRTFLIGADSNENVQEKPKS